jgi:enamine deaminase RidA (YjgF/YER057c/UK114 family)
MDRRQFLEQSALLAGGAAGASLISGENTMTQAHSAEEQIKKLGLDLPVIPKNPASIIVGCVRAGDLLFVSGHTPVAADGKNIVGRLGADMDVKAGQEAAKIVALRVLSVVRAELGSLDKVVRLVKALGMVACTPEFTQTPAVVNGFSDLMIQVFGDAGKGARSAVGMAALPGGVPVEVEVIFQVR